MQDIRLCVCDLDGTLLNSHDKINHQDLSSLLKLASSGIPTVIATGRCELQILEYIDQLQITGPVITCNGGFIKNVKDNQILRCKKFEYSKVIELITFCNDNNLDYLVYQPECVYYPPNAKRVEKFKKYNTTAQEKHRVPLTCVTDADENILFHNTLKVLVIGNDDLRKRICSLFNSDDNFTAVMSGENLIDIMPGYTTKGDGIKFLCQTLSIPLEKVIVFGDSPNDLSMFNLPCISVCMGNANDEMKKQASFVTLSNDEYGITHALKNFNII